MMNDEKTACFVVSLIHNKDFYLVLRYKDHYCVCWFFTKEIFYEIWLLQIYFHKSRK